MTMRKLILAALVAAAMPVAAEAQQAAITQTIAGTRLDITATGEVTRVPDVAVISAGVVTRSTNAGAAMREAAARMARVRAQLTAAGVADRDIQTSNVSLNPDYVYDNNKPPRITGYNAQNTVTVRFRNIADAGKILDALVAVGSNQINGPSFVIDKPEAALDEARARAVAMGRARADLYARSLGLRVVRVVAVTENGGGYNPPPPMPMAVARMEAQADTKIDPGEQKVQVSLTMTYELQ